MQLSALLSYSVKLCERVTKKTSSTEQITHKFIVNKVTKKVYVQIHIIILVWEVFVNAIKSVPVSRFVGPYPVRKSMLLHTVSLVGKMQHQIWIWKC